MMTIECLKICVIGRRTSEGKTSPPWKSWPGAGPADDIVSIIIRLIICYLIGLVSGHRGRFDRSTYMFTKEWSVFFLLLAIWYSPYSSTVVQYVVEPISLNCPTFRHAPRFKLSRSPLDKPSLFSKGKRAETDERHRAAANQKPKGALNKRTYRSRRGRRELETRHVVGPSLLRLLLFGSKNWQR